MARHSPSVVQWAKELETSHDPETLLNKLQSRYSNPASLSTTISNIRHHCIDQALNQEARQQLIDKFPALLSATTSPKELLRVQRLASQGKFIPGDEDINRWVADLPLFASWFTKFCLPPTVVVPKSTSTTKRAIAIKNIDGLTQWLESASQEANFYVHVLACALCSGRRTIEILRTGNFQLIPGKPFAARFSGQVKKRGQNLAYTIPLLLPFDQFIFMIQSIRAEIGQAFDTDEDRVRVSLHQKYASTLRYQLKRILGDFFSENIRVHDLRGVYAKLTYDRMSHDTDLTFPGWVQSVLGHESEIISIHYNRIRGP